MSGAGRDATDLLREALGLGRIEAELAAIRALLEQGSAAAEPSWFNLRAACARKGLEYGGVKSRPWLQPNGGQADATVGGRRVWSCESVVAWLSEVDPPRQASAIPVATRAVAQPSVSRRAAG